MRFAFDHPKYQNTVEKALVLLEKYKIQAMWYVLVGFNTTFKEDLKRINFLHGHGQRSYVMRYKNCRGDKKYIELARWVNSPCWRNSMTFTDFLKRQKIGGKHATEFAMADIDN